LSLGVRAKLIVISVGVISLSTVAAYLYLSRELERALIARIEQDLRTRVDLVAHGVGWRAGRDATGDDWDALADDLGRHAQARITIVGRDGVVLGDSQVPAHALGAVENHGSRSEVSHALAEGFGTSERLSGTVGERMLYVAVPFVRDGEVAGVARAALPLTEVEGALGTLREILTIAFVLGLLVAVVLSTVAAEISSRQARALTLAARRMAGGDLDARTGAAGSDELAQLGAALDQLASSLSSTLSELRAERDRMAGVVTGMQEGLLLLDRGRCVALVNPALREMLLLGSDVVGQPLPAAIREGDLVDLLERGAQLGTPTSGEIEIGGLRPSRLLVHVVPLPGDGGGSLAVFVDVTHLRRLETLRRDFVANASHELRTPIAAIQSAAETLDSGAKDDPEAAGRFVRMIERNAARLRTLVEDMLDLSRIEAHDFRIQREDLELRSVVEPVLDLFRERARMKDLELHGTIEPPDLAASVDRRGLEHVLTNLIDNAVKYCGTGCRVRVGAQRTGETVTVAVSDDGPGISGEHLPRLFERFYRVDAGRSRELGGTGLGLAIVKHLAEAMGGSVQVESTPGRGTTFRVVLAPAARDPRDA
jgi:two-component system, OmpR family, phosphate regulon sensor histidine kinase PhoR